MRKSASGKQKINGYMGLYGGLTTQNIHQRSIKTKTL